MSKKKKAKKMPIDPFDRIELLTPKTLFNPDPPVAPFLPFQKHSMESRDAAESMKPHVATLLEQVFKVIHDEPEGLTDEEICLILGKKGDTVRPRRIELVNDERIHASGKRHTRSGRFAVVWVAN